MSAVSDGWEATEAAATAWTDLPVDIDWDLAVGPVRPPLAVLAKWEGAH